MRPATHFLIAFGLSINLFADSFVSASFSSLSAIKASLSNDANSTTTSYIVEFASTASGSSRKKRSLTVSISYSYGHLQANILLVAW